MITTKGIIESVETVSGITQYRVRMPLFHETKTSSNITTKQLPLAIYPLPPHMEGTVLKVGDVVECSLEDGGLDTIVIHGLIPSSSIQNTAGSTETESQISMTNVNTISFNMQNGIAELPYKIKILADKDANELVESSNKQLRNYIDGEDLSYLKGLNAPLIETLTKIQETLDYLERTLLRTEVQVFVENPGRTKDQVESL